MIKKIITSIVDGSFCKKVKSRLVTHIYRINDSSIENQIRRVHVYNSLYKRYHHILDAGVENTGTAERSNKIWICWFQGYEDAPDLVKACINSVRRNMPEYEIVFLSNDNLSEYVQFPDYIEEKRKLGIIGQAHYSDLVRMALLCKYGGLWLDATVLCTSGEFTETLKGLPLFVYKDVRLDRSGAQPIVSSSWLISAHSNQPILLMTQKLLHEYWRREKELKEYFIFHLFFAMSARKFADDWAHVPAYNNVSPHILQFELEAEFTEKRWSQILGMSAFHKLNHHKDYTKFGASFYQHIVDKFVPGIEESMEVDRAGTL